MELFKKAIFLATTYQSLLKIQFFYRIFIKNFPKQLCFRQTRENLAHGF